MSKSNSYDEYSFWIWGKGGRISNKMTSCRCPPDSSFHQQLCTKQAKELPPYIPRPPWMPSSSRHQKQTHHSLQPHIEMHLTTATILSFAVHQL